MKVITSIYLKCRPDLRDEWLTGAEVDDAQDALVSLSCDPTLPLLFHVASVFSHKNRLYASLSNSVSAFYVI